MKVVVIDGATEEEVKRILEMAGVARKATRTAASTASTAAEREYDAMHPIGDVGRRIPRRVPRGSKVQHYVSPHSARKYVNDELKKIRAFYLDSKNHYYNVDIVGSKLSRFARSIRRTPMALSVKFIAMRLNRRLIRGRSRQRQRDLGTPSMLRSHPVVPQGFDRERIALANVKPRRQRRQVIFNPYRFPKFVSVQNQELVHSMLSSLIRGGGSIRESDASALGINDWEEFLQEVLIESKSICAYIRRPNNLKVEMSGGEKILAYRK